MAKISIVVLTYNSANYIKPCLDSICAQGYRDFEIIVIDNGSNDNTLKIVEENYAFVRLVKNSLNEGAAKARNQGIEAAGGEWIVTLDCDIMLENNFLGKIVDIIKDAPETTGMIQPKIMRVDKNRIFSAGIYVSFLRRFYDLGNNAIDSEKFNKKRNIFGVCSAAAVYKRDMLEAVREENGYFDERFFFLFEDVDLSWRAQKKGIRALFSPDAVCYHYGNSSHTPKNVRQYLCLRNRYFTLLKNDSPPRIILSFILYDIPRLLYFLIINPCALRAINEVFGFKHSR